MVLSLEQAAIPMRSAAIQIQRCRCRMCVYLAGAAALAAGVVPAAAAPARAVAEGADGALAARSAILRLSSPASPPRLAACAARYSVSALAWSPLAKYASPRAS